MTANGLIDLTLKEIARYYQPGMLAYTKKINPVEWGKFLAIEQEINRAALEDDLKGVDRALQAYKQAVLGVEHREAQGSLFEGQRID